MPRVSLKTMVSLRLPGQAFADGDDASVAGPADDLGVDAAAVVLGRGGAGLVVDGDQGAVDDPRFRPVGWWRAGEFGEVGFRPVGDAVHGGVGDAEECCELLPGQVRAVGRDEQRDPVGETRTPGNVRGRCPGRLTTGAR